MMSLCMFGYSQVTIRGIVRDASGGAGLNAASVSLREGKAGTATDAQGAYVLRTNLGRGAHVIVFSAVGYTSTSQTLVVDDRTEYVLNAELTPGNNKLDEVIVTGTAAGTTRRQVGSYVSSIKAEELTKGATGNVLAALQGKTAGAQIVQNSGDPAGGMSVRLRGISSVSSSSEPLYIVDGVIVNAGTTRVTNTSSNYDGGNFIGTIGQSRMSDINPEDIDHIEVLNGAAAAAIYGSRANAGVVQIFTKRGRSGKAKVSFSTSLLMNSLRKSVPVNHAPVKFGGPADGPTAQTQDLLTPTLTTTSPVTRYDYWDYIFRKGTGTDNNVSVSGGTDNTKYYLSGGYYYNQGIIKNTNFQRYSFRSNIEQTLSKWISVNLGLNYINSSGDEKPDGNSFFSPMNSITILGNFHDIETRSATGNIMAIGERGRVNPVSVIEDIKQRQATNRIMANVGARLTPLKGLLINYTMGIDNYAQNGTTFIPPFAYNVSTAFYGGGANLDPTQNGYASTANNNYFGINHDLNANYTFNITPNVQSVTQVGYSEQYESNRYIMTQSRGFAPFIQTVGGGATVLPSADERSELSLSGIFAQQNFKLYNQLFLTAAIRRDGSSVFGPKQRNQIYKKFSASYVPSSAAYWAGTGFDKFWDMAKIRVAYGESGNLTGIGAYDRFNTYTSTPFLSRSTLLGSSRLADENIRPERQEELEFGLDLGFAAGRIGFTANVYRKKVKDLLINRIIAPTTGYSSYMSNVGSLENKGFELVLNGSPVRSKDFEWNISAIYNHNRNKVINTGQKLILFATNAGAPIAIIEGQPVGVFYGTFFATTPGGSYSYASNGLPNNQGLVLNAAGIPRMELGVQNSSLEYTPQRDANGQPTGAQLRKIIGDPNPDYTATLVNEINFKGISLRVQFDRVSGNEVFNADFRTRQGVGNGQIAEMEHNGSIPRGYISATNGIYNIEQWRIDDGSFTKLREVSLSYNFGTIKKVSDLTLSISGRNLVSWDKYRGFDPEVNAGGQSTLLRGIDFGTIPIPRTLSIGLKANF